MDEIDYVVFHQANKLILDSLMEKMNIPREKYCIDVEELGNTVSSTIPIALQRAVKSGEIKSGMRVLLAGFGVGYSWGGTILKIDGGKY
jgi:3-oxoacyl-[acyl-carrier-protein] synthase-3